MENNNIHDGDILRDNGNFVSHDQVKKWTKPQLIRLDDLDAAGKDLNIVEVTLSVLDVVGPS